MEKPTKTKSKKPSKALFKVASFSFASPPPSSRGPAGPVSIVPTEARRRRTRDSGGSLDLDAIFPTSPEVSCIGRVKSRSAVSRSFSENAIPPSPPHRKERSGGKPSVLGKILGRKGKKKQEEKSPDQVPAAGPSLGEMRRFSSSRGALAGFDWRAHVVAAVEPVECVDGEEGGGDGEEEEKVRPRSRTFGSF